MISFPQKELTIKSFDLKDSSAEDPDKETNTLLVAENKNNPSSVEPSCLENRLQCLSDSSPSSSQSSSSTDPEVVQRVYNRMQVALDAETETLEGGVGNIDSDEYEEFDNTEQSRNEDEDAEAELLEGDGGYIDLIKIMFPNDGEEFDNAEQNHDEDEDAETEILESEGGSKNKNSSREESESKVRCKDKKDKAL